MRPGHPTPIVPVLLGTEEAALTAAADLLDQGLLVPAIRPPTVPAGTSRLRIALSAAHTDDQIDRLAAALAGLTSGPALPPSPADPRGGIPPTTGIRPAPSRSPTGPRGDQPT